MVSGQIGKSGLIAVKAVRMEPDRVPAVVLSQRLHHKGILVWAQKKKQNPVMLICVPVSKKFDKGLDFVSIYSPTSMA